MRFETGMHGAPSISRRTSRMLSLLALPWVSNDVDVYYLLEVLITPRFLENFT